MLDNLQARTPLERRMRSVGVVLDSVLLSQQLGILLRDEQLNIQDSCLDIDLLNDSINGFSPGEPGGM